MRSFLLEKIMSTNADVQEAKMFARIKGLLGNPDVYAMPAGSDQKFPDFGFNVNLNGKMFCVQFEYKLNSKAQMGSMRDWVFDGNEFTANNITDEKEVLLYAMNHSAKCVKRGKEILKEFQTYANKNIKSIYSGMLTFEKDSKKRKAMLLNYIHGKKTDYQLAKVADQALGDIIIDLYRAKFNKSLNRQANGGNILFMVIGEQIYYVEKTSGVKQADVDAFAKYFGVNKIVKLDNLSASLEVRIQPRHVDKDTKPVSIDVMANLRLNGLSSTGTKVP